MLAHRDPPGRASAQAADDLVILSKRSAAKDFTALLRCEILRGVHPERSEGLGMTTGGARDTGSRSRPDGRHRQAPARIVARSKVARSPIRSTAMSAGG